MPFQHRIVIVPGLSELADAFASRLRSPFSSEDAASPAERSVLGNVAMAYFNNDQIPIPSGTSAEGGVAHVLSNAAQEVLLISRRVPEAFVGSRSLWVASAGLSAPNHSPFLLIEEENEFDIGVYDLVVSEVEPFLGGTAEHRQELIDIITAEHQGQGAAVISFSIEISDQEASWDEAYREQTSET